MTTLIDLALSAAPMVPCIPRRDVAMILDPNEVNIAKLIGETRDRQSRRAGNVGFEISPADRLRRNENAAGAELAVARFLDRYPTAFVGRPAEAASADVGPYQVRNTQTDFLYLYAPENPSGIRPSDPADTYILVIGSLPSFRIVGWYIAHDGMRDDYWRTNLRCPCWAVPSDCMHPFLIGERTT